VVLLLFSSTKHADQPWGPPTFLVNM